MVFGFIRTKLNVWVSSYVPPPPRDQSEEPRRILLIHAHPRSDSYSRALADAVEAGAKEGGHAVRRFALYDYSAENKGELGGSFQPCLTATEQKVYGETAMGTSRLAPDVRSALVDLHWCDSLVFVYPTWWFNMPAMLKGYLDRVMVPGPGGAFDMPPPDGKGVSPKSGLVPLLTNVKRVAGVSTYGAPRHLVFLGGDNGRNTLATAVRPNFAPDCTCLWLGLYKMDTVNEKERGEFVNFVKAKIRDDF